MDLRNGESGVDFCWYGLSYSTVAL
jgi:hypothetical protein